MPSSSKHAHSVNATLIAADCVGKVSSMADEQAMESGIPPPRGGRKRAARSLIETSLRTWCETSGIRWQERFLLDRKSWNALRRARYFRGQNLPAADWVLHVADEALYQLVNQTNQGDKQYKDLQTYLRSCGVGLHRIASCFVRVYILTTKELREGKEGKP